MKKRFKLSRPTSKRIFRKTADRTHMFNIGASPMRGGIRM